MLSFFGELRDLDSMETALTAANTGHLVFSTLHTNNAPDTINRILAMVQPHRKKLFRMEFASSLRAIICQKLVMRKDQKGLVPVIEILINNPRIRALLENDEISTSVLNEVMETSKDAWGMQTFNQHLIDLITKNIITKEIGLSASPSPEKLNLHFSGLSHQNSENNKVLKLNESIKPVDISFKKKVDYT